MNSLKEAMNRAPAPTFHSEEDRWLKRARIILMEPDAALRSVLVRTLLRAGCVVAFRRTFAQVTEALAEGLSDGAIVAVDGDPRQALLLDYLNAAKVRLIVLTLRPADPVLMRALPEVRFFQKPFDTRLLLDALGISNTS